MRGALQRARRNGWSAWHAAGVIALAALGILGTREAWGDILRIARADEESSHIVLVPLVAAWMVWARRWRLRLCRPEGQWAGPAVAALGWGAGALGYAQSIQALWHLGAVMVLVGCVLSVLGTCVLRRFGPAVLVLAFLVPVPGMVRQQVAGPLQTATAAAAQAVFEALGLGVERSGNLLTINGVDVAVAEACNGLRMAFALVLVSAAFAFSIPLRMGVRAIILLASPFVAIACNVVRLVPTIALYGYAPAGVADAAHDAGGWLMLPLALGLLMSVTRVLRWALIPVGRFNLALS